MYLLVNFEYKRVWFKLINSFVKKNYIKGENLKVELEEK